MKKFVFVVFLVLFGLGVYFAYQKLYSKEDIVLHDYLPVFKDEEIINKQNYQECLLLPYKDDTLDTLFSEALSSYQSDEVAIYYKDINNDYVWNMNSTKIYYSASTSKLFEVIYLVEQAREGTIDLDSTLVYKPSDARQSSKGMKNHKFYEEFSLSKLINYLLTYSDNTAHIMLINYIGIDTLKAYFSDYNLVILQEDPYVRNYTAIIAERCLERLYSVIEIDDDYSTLIKDSMNNDYMNYLSFDDKVFYHKYGYYASSFHDIGIYDSDDPYIVVILTLYGNLGQNVFGSKVNEISKKIYEIYNKNQTLKENYCNNTYLNS